MNKIIAILLGLMITMITANGQLPEKIEKNKTYTTSSGLQIMFTEINSKNKQPKTGDIVKVHYTGKLINDSIFDSSVKRGTPISFALGQGKVIKGWDEGIGYLHIGDKAVLSIPANLGYGERKIGTIPANSKLIFDVELIDVTEGVKPFDAKGKDTVTTASGLKYIIVKKGGGIQAASGKTIKVHYTGYFTDGKIFDSSVERGEAFSFVLGQGRVIKGWDEGVALMKTGEKVRMIIPYQLGYGENDYGPIKGKSTLIFDVELLEVK